MKHIKITEKYHGRDRILGEQDFDEMILVTDHTFSYAGLNTVTDQLMMVDDIFRNLALVWCGYDGKEDCDENDFVQWYITQALGSIGLGLSTLLTIGSAHFVTNQDDKLDIVKKAANKISEGLEILNEVNDTLDFNITCKKPEELLMEELEKWEKSQADSAN